IVEATLIDGFVPTIGDEFQVLIATQVVGEFDIVETIDEEDVLGFALSDIYSSMDVILRVDDVFLIGDYNDDGRVNAADYAAWRNNLGAPAGTLPNDIEDGPIGIAQYNIWKSHFGNKFPDPGALSAGEVPEPQSLLIFLMFAGTAGFASYAKRTGRLP
ncbi:MAG: hypothetical protein ACR2NU_11315, partial [Aeoliella sp.]